MSSLKLARYISVFRSSLNTRFGVRRQRARNEPGDAAFCERGARERILCDLFSLRLFAASRSAPSCVGVQALDAKAVSPARASPLPPHSKFQLSNFPHSSCRIPNFPA